MVDLLALCAHPDDLEVCAGGLFLLAKQQGLTTGLIILTDGAASGRASAKERRAEALAAAKILELDFFEHLNFPDAALQANQHTIDQVLPVLAKASPRHILTLHPEDYHPDHIAASHIAQTAAFTAGLPRHSQTGEDWHYENLFFFAADPRTAKARPELLFDITQVMEQKLQACKAHASQDVLPYARAMSSSLGMLAGVPYAEGLYLHKVLKVHHLSALFAK